MFFAKSLYKIYTFKYNISQCSLSWYKQIFFFNMEFKNYQKLRNIK